MKQPVERRLAAILAADVAGYSRLMGADEEGTLDRLKAHRRELVDPKITEHRGRIVKTTGDGMLVEFPSVVDAVRCAVEMQRAMVDSNAETLENNRITFRVGVNLGDVIIDGDDIYGDGVNIAARLEALAEPGGICVSRVVRDQIRDKLPYPFEDMGEQSVKNIARPVRVYALPAAAVASTPLVAVPPQPGPAHRGISPHRAAIVASVVAVMGIGIAAWWAWPQGNSPMVSVRAPAAASPQIPPVASTPAPRLSMVVKVRPALLTRMCTPPNRDSAIATTRSQSAGWRRSATSGRICPAKLEPAVAASTSPISASIWPTATTLCPSRARPNAIARPRPRNPPVTIATRCSISIPPELFSQ
jgi:adenylate cyclase